MNIFCIDTSTTVAGCCIYKDTKIVGEFLLDDNLTHSQKLMPMVDYLFKTTSTEVTDIDYFCSIVGPGSFTGIRIGISTIKAMAQVNNKPCIGISLLDSLCYNVSCFDGIICPMIDARNNNVYSKVSIFEGNKLVNLSDYIAEDINVIIDEVLKHNKKTMFLGDGAYLHKDLIINRLGSLAHFVDINLNYPKASSIVCASLNSINNDEILTYNEIVPMYLRKSQAERVCDNKC